MITTIYRTGQMTVANHDETVTQKWEKFDSRRPEGHVRRQESLFAAPDFPGAHKWLGNLFLAWQQGHYSTFLFNEITVESDNVHVYLVEHYERVCPCCPGGECDYGISSNIHSYWNTSMTLTQWISEIGEDPYGCWEVLLPEKEVISCRVLTYEEIRAMYIKEGMTDFRLEMLDKDIRPLLEEATSVHLQGSTPVILTASLTR